MIIVWLLLALLLIPILISISGFFVLVILIVIGLIMFNGFADWWSNVGSWIVLGGFAILMIIAACEEPLKRLISKYNKKNR